jgi:GTPase SAR1 family protein
VLCFAISVHASYENIKKKWIPEIKQNVPSAPIILVGTKADLRQDDDMINQLKLRGKTPITTEQGETLAKDIGAVKYVECSAMRNEHVKDVFNEAIRATLFGVTQKPKESKCALL